MCKRFVSFDVAMPYVRLLTQLIVNAESRVLQTSSQKQTRDPSAVSGGTVPVFQRYLLVDDVHEIHGRGHLGHGPRFHVVSRVRFVGADNQVRVLVVVQVHSAGHRKPECRYGPSAHGHVLRPDHLGIPFPDASLGAVVYVHGAQFVGPVVRSADSKI